MERKNVKTVYPEIDSVEEEPLTVVSQSFADSLTAYQIREVQVKLDDGTVETKRIVEEAPLKQGDKLVGRYGKR